MDADLGVRPLTPRSLILSVMLGTHPPRLPAGALVALGELFGIPSGTTRTALSRMVADGELLADGGKYGLTSRLLERQAGQDAGRQSVTGPWDGTWWFALIVADRSTLQARRAFRARMRDARMGELGPGRWTRPANTAGPPDDSSDVIVTKGGVGRHDPLMLAGRLWNLPALRDRSRMLLDAVADAHALIETGNPAVLPRTVVVSIAAIRHVLADPQLPIEIVGDGWPTNRLRSAYDELEREHGRVLRALFRRAM